MEDICTEKAPTEPGLYLAKPTYPRSPEFLVEVKGEAPFLHLTYARRGTFGEVGSGVPNPTWVWSKRLAPPENG